MFGQRFYVYKILGGHKNIAGKQYKRHDMKHKTSSTVVKALQ